MLFPSIEKLTNKGEKSTYSLVLAVAKRARKISDISENEGIPLTEKAVKTAVRELAEGKISFRERK